MKNNGIKNRIGRTVHFSAAFVLLLSTVSALSGADAQSPEKKWDEGRLIAVLKSDAGLKEKCDACRLLTRIGTAKAVPALASLLADEKLSHMARYALESNPSPSADRALAEALGKLKGDLRAGVIGSIGVRRFTPATGVLRRLLLDEDREVAQAAGRALGAFGTPDAAEALESALKKTAQENRPALIEGLLRCAEKMAAGAEKKKALDLYDRLWNLEDTSHQVRTAALRGAVLLRPHDAGLPLLSAALRGRDLAMANAAVRTTMEMPGKRVTEALSALLDEVPSANQVLLIKALGERGDASALPALFHIAETGSKVSRITVIRSLVEIGGGASVPVLVKLLNDTSDDVVKAAQKALAAMTGPAAGSAVEKMLAHNDPEIRGVAVDLLGRRLALGGMDGKKLFPKLAGMLESARSPDEIEALEALLSKLCVRFTRPQPGEVTIRSAVYGDLPDGASADVTGKVAAIVKKGSLSIKASNANFGDPAQGTPKKLKVKYAVNGRLETKTVNENDTLTIVAGTTPQAFIDTLRAALPTAGRSAKAALLRLLKSTRGSEKKGKTKEKQ